MKQIVLKNSIALDKDLVGNIFEIKWTQKKKIFMILDVYNQEVECIENNSNDPGDEILLHKISNMDCIISNLYDQKLNILFYVAGFVVKQITPKVFCITWEKSLLLMRTNNYYSHKDYYTKFVDLKNVGCLVSASSSVFEIIKETK